MQKGQPVRVELIQLPCSGSKHLIAWSCTL